jgi:hypothetical protein
VPLIRLRWSWSCSPLRGLGTALLALAWAMGASAQADTKGIYTCIDSKGRRITSDRPIPECLDREQHQMGNSGVVRRVVPPSYTAEERARLDAQRKQEAEQRARVAEEQRRDRALLARYPNQALHEKARADALNQIDDVVAAVKKLDLVLLQQRQKIDNEMEFYQRDPTKAPAALRRQYEEYQQQVQAQQRFLDEQEQQKQRVNARFDEELVKLRQLWAVR